MDLRGIVARYQELTGGFGRPAPLSGFGLSRAETERLFSALDEDYHISRYFHFSTQGGEAFQINGFSHTHVAIDAKIEEIL